MVFPQERAASYVSSFDTIDMLIIDEFYKASIEHDKERSSSLLRAILKLSKVSNQRYFLAPNINKINDSVFTSGMEVVTLDFKTVYLEKHYVFEHINQNYDKSDALVDVLSANPGKTLIYAGTISEVKKVTAILCEYQHPTESPLLRLFSNWLENNYSKDWQLTRLIEKGCGFHTGKLHRSISQIQIKLFDDLEFGIQRLVSTSSIIEGVNTSAENVILWRNKKGTLNLKDFDYKNIIGRGGRMLRHFTGNIFLLEKPPKEEDNQLNLEFTEELVTALDESDFSQELTPEQIAKIISYKEEMAALIGHESFSRLQRKGAIKGSDASVILKVTRSLVDEPENWRGLGYLNSGNPDNWENSLYRLLKLMPGSVGAGYTKVVTFIKIISNNWKLPLPELLNRLSLHDVGVDDFFELERAVSYNLASFLNDFNAIQLEVLKDSTVDISPFIAKVSHAFLPPNVYTLEEYGLPRMISKKIHEYWSFLGVLDLEKEEIPIHSILDAFNEFGEGTVLEKTESFDEFDKYIVKHFYDGIRMP